MTALVGRRDTLVEMMRKKTICPLDCPDSCGLIATVENGKVVGLSGDPDHPYTRGVICRKMRRYPERLYARDRILYPAKRTGQKGTANFTRICWDEALAIIAERLQKTVDCYGGEAILPYAYAGNMGLINRFAGYPLFHKLGATRVLETICSATAAAGWQKHLGTTPGCPPENAADAELIVAWGINIKVSNLHFWPFVTTARKRGGKLLVIDPYRNATAKSSDYYVQVKPGGDAALALGLLKAVISEGRVDEAFVASHTTGFAQLRDVATNLTWAELQEASGVAEATCIWLARLLADTPKTFFRLGIGLTRNSRGGMAVRCIVSLAAVLGLLGGGQGRGVLLTSRGFRGQSERLTYPALRSGAGRTINMVHLGHALTTLEPPVKAMLVYNCNPATVAPDSSRVREGLKREDLFTVVHEQVMTPTARYADILLPATTSLENRDLYAAYGHFYLGTTAPVIPPLGEARSNFDFFQALSAKMGFTDPPFQQTVEERMVDYLKSVDGLPEGGAEQALVAGSYVQSTFSSADGQILQAGTTTFPFVVDATATEPALPCLVPSGEFGDPDVAARYPLCLITPPHRDLLNSTFGERYPDRLGEVLVHPQDGNRYGISDNMVVRLANWRGTTRRIARLSEDTQPGLVVAEGLYWLTGSDDGGINELTSQKCSDMGGGAIFHEARVRVTPAGP